MIITKAALDALRTGFNANFQTGLGAASNASAPLVTTVTSTTRIETYGFLGDMPIFKKWLGEKQIKSLEEKAYVLANEDFEVTVGIHRNKIEDDNLGLYGPIFNGWGQEAGALKDRLAFDALANGHQRLCYDGQYFFDTDHLVNGLTVSNMSGVGTVAPWYLVDLSKPLKPIIYQNRKAPKFTMITNPDSEHVFLTGEYLAGGEARGAAGYSYWQLAHRSTATMDETGYKAAYDAMASLTNDEGEPLGIRPTHVVFGSSNRAAAKKLFEAMNKAGGESNIYFKDIQLIEAPRLP